LERFRQRNEKVDELDVTLEVEGSKIRVKFSKPVNFPSYMLDVYNDTIDVNGTSGRQLKSENLQFLTKIDKILSD